MLATLVQRSKGACCCTSGNGRSSVRRRQRIYSSLQRGEAEAYLVVLAVQLRMLAAAASAQLLMSLDESRCHRVARCGGRSRRRRRRQSSCACCCRDGWKRAEERVANQVERGQRLMRWYR